MTVPRPVLRLGSSGAFVRVLHQLLAEQGFPCEGPEVAQAGFGVSTWGAVGLFQASNVGRSGATLSTDGVVGVETWWALEHAGSEPVSAGAPATFFIPEEASQAPSNTVAAAALLSAASEYRRGVREVPNGSNRGPRVDVYTGLEGRPVEVAGPPWCAYFASWNFAKAPGGSPFGRQGGALAIVEYCLGHLPGSVVDTSSRHLVSASDVPSIVKPGDLGVIDTGGGHGHVYQVAGVLGYNLWSVEGNSGNAVRVRERKVASTRWFINFDRYARERGLG